MNHHTTATAIIGAGFSGLAAGERLYASGHDFLVLEARNRVGGRTLTKHYHSDIKLELGGQWIGPTQDTMYELAQRYGVETFRTFNAGRNVLDLNQQIKTYQGLIPKVNVFSLLELELTLRKLERMAKQLDTAAPWAVSKAHQWDNLPFSEFLLRQTCTSAARKILWAGLETVYGCDLAELSLLHALFYIRAGTSLEVLLNIDGGAQQDRLKGGMQGLALCMAAPFQERILLGSPVQTIVRNGDAWHLYGEQQVVHAKHVVLALPPSMIAQIRFEPPLPQALAQKIQGIPMGRVAKLLAVYETPFWRQDGFSGQVVADEYAPFQTVFDVSSPEHRFGVLLAFCIGRKLELLFQLDKNQRRDVVLHHFNRYFGAKAYQPVLYEDHTWTDESWSQGCYAGVYTPGLWTSAGHVGFSALPYIYWAGTEASERWYGYIEGAVLSGYKAADAVLNAVNS